MKITMQHASMMITRCDAIDELSPVEASLVESIVLSLVSTFGSSVLDAPSTSLSSVVCVLATVVTVVSVSDEVVSELSCDPEAVPEFDD